MEDTFLIIHGHFYQPPREDPWTLEIEYQASAYPFHNWNERINRECYAANAASRVLDNSGRIIDIINNYEFISFNFGPTLLKWIKNFDPKTFERIIEADRKSMERNNGHGNAIAQVYNHIILPLACEKDIITEVEWGLKAFEIDFGRESEGIWLSETAINDKVAEILIDYGIKFIILSPQQAEKVILDGKEVDVSNGNIDTSKPYFLEEKNGRIAVFFYNQEIASKVSFQHLLRNVEFLRGEILRFKGSLSESKLINYATDGEVYGHHEPFGDMCLARLIYENKIRKDFNFTNYANFLESHPPVAQVILKKGNEALGTSWSCIHGVDRWRRDCGCSEGGKEGYNQKWREPLRLAFDFLRDRLFEKALEILPHYLTDFWKARNDYITYIYDFRYDKAREERKKFLSRNARKALNENEEKLVMKLMEALHMELLMYTSCGWFFSEISGIETIQNMKYACQLLYYTEELFSQEVEIEFLNILSRAKSNISEFGNGKDIFNEQVKQKFISPGQILFEYLLLRHLDYLENTKNLYFYTINIIAEKNFSKNDLLLEKYLAEVENNLTGVNEKYIAILVKIDHNFYCFVKKFKDEYFMNYLDRVIKKSKPEELLSELKEWLGSYYTLKNISYSCKQKVLYAIFREKMKTLHQYIEVARNEITSYIDIIESYGEHDIIIPEEDRIAIQELLNTFILGELKRIEEISDFSLLIRCFKAIKKAKIKLNYTDILPIIQNNVLKITQEALSKFNKPTLKKLENIINFTNSAEIEFEKYEVQNIIFQKVKELKYNPSKYDIQTINLFFEIARKFNIGVEEV